MLFSICTGTGAHWSLACPGTRQVADLPAFGTGVRWGKEETPRVPEICRFYGIVIAVFFSEHNPPHFHARYGDEKAAVDIQTLRVLEGGLPARALRMVVEWAGLHQRELMEDWELVRAGRQPKKIEPLR